MIKISIIMVCLNEKDTIEGSIKSVLEQSYKNIELIIIDGDSTDGTVEIIKKHQEKIAYFSSQKDNGIYEAMNNGIKASSGDFLFFLNANDVFYDEKILDKIAEALTNNPDTEFLFGDVCCVRKNNEEQIRSFSGIKDIYSLMFNNICHQSVFYKKSLFEKIGLYNPKYKIYSDWEFNIKCLVQHKVNACYLPFTIAKFNMEGISSETKIKPSFKRERKEILKKYFPALHYLVFANNLLKKRLPLFYELFLDKSGLKKFLIKLAVKKCDHLNIKKLKKSDFKQSCHMCE